MISLYRMLFILSLLLCWAQKSTEAADAPKRQWNAYWLTGGANTENGYQWLLISQHKLEELSVRDEAATPFAPKAPLQILDAPALWIETHRKNAIWNSDGQPIKIPPHIKNYRIDERKVDAGDVEYMVESLPMEIAIQLLKAPLGNGRLHRLYPPFSGMENTANALIALLETETAVANSPEETTDISDWQGFVLTGGEYANGGYRWLMLSQVSLQELANANALDNPKSNQAVPAVWVLTYGRDKDWTAVKSLEVPPQITNFQAEKQTVMVDGVEYKVESVPLVDAFPLLSKEQEKMQRSSVGPLYTRNRTALALKQFIESETNKTAVALAPTKLSVGSTFGGERNVIKSTIAEADSRSGTPHGLQVVLGPEKRLRELAVYDNGFLERRETYIEDGFELVHEQCRREPMPGGHGGNGYRQVWGKGATGSPPASLTQGYLLDGKPWHGNFVFVESTPERKAYETSLRLVLREYVEGKIVATKTDVTLGFGEREKEQTWLKNLPSALKDQ